MATSTPTTLSGTPVVPGLALGPVLRARTEIDPKAIAAYAGPDSPEAALEAYDVAVGAVSDGFSARAAKASGAAAEVLTASAGLARDKGLRSTVRKNLNGGDALLASVDGAVEFFAGLFAQQGGLMAERVTDLRDINKRIVAHLVGEPEPGVPTPTEPSVLVAEDLAPSDTAGLDPALVVALVTEKGGSTSHTAIISRQLGIPCVVGVHGALDLASGARVLVDGATGSIEVAPDEDDAARRVAADVEERAALATWSGPAMTSDGVPVKLLANVADAESARQAAEAPVEGVGLFRTELSFLSTKDEPSVEEQAEVYAGVLTPFGSERYVVVRTLDAGSDKPIAYATKDHEENPALGVRGLRLAFDNPGLLERQLDGIALAAKNTGTEPWVMAPMVATIAEAKGFADQVRERGLKPGIMIEIPSAAILAHQMLEVVDFLSIGTNDLTQYTMAADRMATDLTHLTDPWQPAVLHLIAITAEAGKQAGKPVGVCGEAAADPLLAPALVGMGITSLSMATAAVRAVGACLAKVSMDACEDAAEAALGASDPMAARAAVREALGLS
ncbi:MAG: ptsP [Nocardioidaceae bacterium]|nr:ptsP [Nocardioidaceae bacterium]